MYEQGMQWQFGLKLETNYGEGTVKELEYLATTIAKFTRVDYMENITYYKSLVNKLKKIKGLE
jgi:hypothetical protein